MRKLLLMIMSAALLLTAACGGTDNGSAEKTIPTTTLPKPPENDISAVSGTSAENSEETSAVTDNDKPLQSTEEKEENDLSITVTINGREFSATLYDNETARTFKELLPLTLDMSELNGNEKYYYLPDSLPRNSSIPSGINAGDIMLYGSDCIVIFYESFSTSYSYTPIGKIDDPDGLAAALGSVSVQVAFS